MIVVFRKMDVVADTAEPYSLRDVMNHKTDYVELQRSQ
jgi:hypothetical protein